MARGAWLTVGAPYFVPVGEEWGVVGGGSLVVGIVLGGATPQAKGHQIVQRPREVVAAVLLHRNVDVEDHEAPSCQAVAAQQDGVDRGPESHAEQLPAGQVLGDEAKRLVVLVVDGVEGAIEPRHLVVQQVPHVVLEVKEHHAAQDAQQEAEQRGRLARQRGGRPPQPLGHSGGEDVQEVVVGGQAQGGPDVGPADVSARVELVVVETRPGGCQHIQRRVEADQDEVGANGEHRREMRAPQELVVIPVEAIPKRLQDRTPETAPGHVVPLRHPGESLGYK